MVNQTVLAILLAHSAPGAISPPTLGAEIARLAPVYDVPAEHIAAIAMLESGGLANAYNAESQDYGLMQINDLTAKHRKISKACLKDWHCNLIEGVKLVSELQKLPHYRPCMYNVGPKRYNTSLCLKYEQKLNKILEVNK